MRLMTKKLLANGLRLCALLMAIGFATPALGQKRSELMAEIDTLKARLAKTENELAQAQKQQKASQTIAESYEVQVNDLKDANATLLKNLGSFAEVSNKNTSALNQALASLANREGELKQIVETLSRNDSIIIALLTDAKKTLGPDARLKVASNSLVISGTLEELFGSDSGTNLSAGSAPWISGVAKLIQAHPSLGATVEGLSMTGDLSLAAQQATAVLNALRGQPGLENAALSARGRDGNFSEGVDILLHPDYRGFYQTVKSQMKH